MMDAMLRQNLLYVVSVVVLGGSAAGMQVAKTYGWLRVIKKPLPIRKPLGDMDRAILSPLRFVVSHRLSPEVELELDTTEYINWVLDSPDTERSWRGPAALSVTYYTGKQDQVPHVPEECFQQGNFSPVDDDHLDFRLPHADITIPVRRLSFQPPGEVGLQTYYIYYTICVNNRFFSERNAARVRMADPRDTHLFYSKIELLFEDVIESRLGDLDEQARELFGRTLRELARSHWPLEGWERGGPRKMNMDRVKDDRASVAW
ncbi:MAG: hypothetical protein V3R87_10735 [Dehalococcoidia bacterium]